ncbi:MAG: sugar-binding transcriptional regulator [Spirochaetes bacterium]|nr:MAG: sugar-binding transcriptional regulator [Spirochaetota bacterium]
MTETDLIYKIASLYYEDNQTQQEIANRLGISRIKVSRLLQQARTSGIVEISLKKQNGNFTDLENRIASQWQLKEVILSSSESMDKDEILSQLGKAASEYAQRVIKGNETISLTWGSTLSAFLQNLPGMDFPKLKIVQMLGGLGSPEAAVHSSDLVRRFSDKTGGIGRFLSAPGVVTSLAVKEGLLKDPHIMETLELAEHADLAFVGIGAPASDSMLMSRGTIISREILDELKAAGAVGDICLRYFDGQGRIIKHPINDRVIGIETDGIRNIPRVVAVAGGPEKTQAVRGALNSGLIDVLITDYKTGKNLLEEQL